MQKSLAAQEKMILTLTTKVERLEGGGGALARTGSRGEDKSRGRALTSISRSASRRASSANKEESQDETAVDPVKVGDFLVLKAADFGGGFFIGDTASRRVGVQTIDVSLLPFFFLPNREMFKEGDITTDMFSTRCFFLWQCGPAICA